MTSHVLTEIEIPDIYRGRLDRFRLTDVFAAGLRRIAAAGRDVAVQGGREPGSSWEF